jgi:hypothetical protein
MPVSLYEVSIPVFIGSLTNLSAVLKKGEAYADEKGIPHAKLLEARLVGDMAALPYQIQRASDTSKGAAVRVAGIENVAMADNETTFEELQARIHKTVEFLKTVEPTSMDGKEESQVYMKTQAGDLKFTAKTYMLHFAVPNFFFHVTTAYGILVRTPQNSCFVSASLGTFCLHASATKLSLFPGSIVPLMMWLIGQIEAYGCADWEDRFSGQARLTEL